MKNEIVEKAPLFERSQNNKAPLFPYLTLSIGEHYRLICVTFSLSISRPTHTFVPRLFPPSFVFLPHHFASPLPPPLRLHLFVSVLLFTRRNILPNSRKRVQEGKQLGRYLHAYVWVSHKELLNCKDCQLSTFLSALLSSFSHIGDIYFFRAVAWCYYIIQINVKNGGFFPDICRKV